VRALHAASPHWRAASQRHGRRSGRDMQQW
jgi:hypothetical protein